MKRGLSLLAGGAAILGLCGHCILAADQPQPQKRFTIRGSVVDADTKQPVPQFKIYKGRNYASGEPLRWDRDEQIAGFDGQFTVRIEDAPAEAGILIEVEGYQPVASPSYPKAGAYTNRFELQKGGGISGTIEWPDGKPAAGIAVLLVDSFDIAIMDTPGQFRTDNQNLVMTTSDDRGHFQLPVRYQPHTVFAAHENGYAEARADRVTETGKLVLQPWGHVKGVLRVGRQLEPNHWAAIQEIGYRYGADGRQMPALMFRLNMRPDRDGKFLFDKVPPGHRKVFLQYKSDERPGPPRLSHDVTVEVKAGETAEVTIGGTGRMVKGKVVVTGGNVDWSHGQHILASVAADEPKAPDVAQLASEEDRKRARSEHSARVRAFWTSDKGRSVQRSMAHYLLLFEPDGSFHVPDVPQGAYKLIVSPIDPLQGPWMFRPLAQLTKDVTIPAGNDPFDLGTFELALKAKPK